MTAPPTRTVGDAVNDLTVAFESAGLDSPRLDARVLIAHVLDLEPSQLFSRGQDVFPESERGTLEAVKARRLRHESVARIRGYREFYGQDYLIGPDTLEPRPDSETLVDAALTLRRGFGDRAVRILDLGTGTGCLLLAILCHWPEATGLGLDISAGAVAVAEANAARLGVAPRAAFRCGNWCDGLDARFDVIVSNPPYIARPDLARLAPEVALFDPSRALDGGEDGLGAYRAFVPSLLQHLTPGGVVLLEVGIGQASAVADMCTAHGLGHAAVYRDLAGVSRVVQATKT